MAPLLQNNPVCFEMGFYIMSVSVKSTNGLSESINKEMLAARNASPKYTKFKDAFAATGWTIDYEIVNRFNNHGADSTQKNIDALYLNCFDIDLATRVMYAKESGMFGTTAKPAVAQVQMTHYVEVLPNNDRLFWRTVWKYTPKVLTDLERVKAKMPAKFKALCRVRHLAGLRKFDPGY